MFGMLIMAIPYNCL